MDVAPGSPRRTVAVLTALLIAIGCLAAGASTATAQSAGDDQYADPLGGGGGGSDDGGGSGDTGGSGDRPTSNAGDPGGAGSSPAAGEAPVAPAAAEPAPTLPRTGADSGLLAALGLALLASGALLRRTARPT